MNDWAVLQTHANCERRALLNLRRQTFIPYVPKYIDKRGAVRPLFPRYVFVLVQDNWRAMLSTIGIAGAIYGTGGKLATVRDAVVQELRSREDARGVIRITPFDATVPVLRAGDVVRISEGSLAGKLGTLVTLRDFDRCVVLLELLGRKINAQVEYASLALA